tara:strand:+ start:400 stop:1698 length:1299 start_codon:yes stop_codon:yes gene_type:complete
MAKDLTIRLLGRPQVSKDSVAGFQKLVRKYVVEGSRASKSGIEDENSPLFLAVGTQDEEFADHFLVNQQLQGNPSSMEKAMLTREYVELRNKFHSETFVQTNDLVKVNRKYTVLRNNDPTYGYGDNWANHPYNGGSSVPWSYAPPQIVPPGNNTHYSLNTNFTVNGASPQVSLATGATDLSTLLSGVNYQGWLRGKASVQAVNPGLDAWDVEYVAPVEPYDTVGTSKGAGSKSVAFTVVGFDTNGIKLSKLGTVASGSSFIMTKTHVAYHIGENLPTDLGNIGGSSGSGYTTSSVSFDIALMDDDGRKYSIQRMIPTAVFDTSSINDLKNIKNSEGEVMGDQVVDDGPSYGVNLIYNPHAQSSTPINELSKSSMPLFQSTPHSSMVGSISWTRRLFDPTGGGSYLSATTVRVTPIFSYGKEKIWKIETTYIG